MVGERIAPGALHYSGRSLQKSDVLFTALYIWASATQSFLRLGEAGEEERVGKTPCHVRPLFWVFET